MKRASLAMILISTVTLWGTAALAQEASPSADPTPSADRTSTRRDLYLDMPYNLGGFEPEIVMTRGEEHFATLEPGDPADGQRRADLQAMLTEVGAEIDDMDSGYALVSRDDLFSFVVAIRVEGVEPGSLLPAYLPILLGDLQDPTPADATVGGKDVVVITSVGETDEAAELHVYDAGDTLWLVQGPDDVVEDTLEDLP